MKIKLQQLRDLTTKAVTNYGYTDKEAEVISKVLLYAQLRGNNQGIVKLTGKGIPKSATGEREIVKETKVSAMIDGKLNHAMVVVNEATDIAINKAQEIGVGIVGVRGINTSSGALGYYAKKIADQGLIGFIYSGSMETVAAHGSFEPIYGTNPFAIGVPSKGEPVVLDMATAAMAYFGVVQANMAGSKLPKDIAYDKNGNLTVEPSDVLDGGALRTFDKGYKGSGLSFMVQALTGPLVGASYTGIGDIGNNWAGHLIIAFDPNILNDVEVLKEGVTAMIGKVKGTKKLPGETEIYIPGEKGNVKTQAILRAEEIEIEDNLYNEFLKVAQ